MDLRNHIGTLGANQSGAPRSRQITLQIKEWSFGRLKPCTIARIAFVLAYDMTNQSLRCHHERPRKEALSLA